jgi:hypothetical protein
VHQVSRQCLWSVDLEVVGFGCFGVTSLRLGSKPEAEPNKPKLCGIHAFMIRPARQCLRPSSIAQSSISIIEEEYDKDYQEYFCISASRYDHGGSELRSRPALPPQPGGDPQLGACSTATAVSQSLPYQLQPPPQISLSTASHSNNTENKPYGLKCITNAILIMAVSSNEWEVVNLPSREGGDGALQARTRPAEGDG